MLGKLNNTATSTGLLILRLGIGGYMLTHGWGKLQRLLEGADWDPIGIGSLPSLILITFAEFFCALLVMAGLFTRLAAIPIVFAMAVAAFHAHGADPWTAGEGMRLYTEGLAERPASKQPALMYLIVFLALMFTGGGRYALDATIAARRAKKKDD